MINKNKVTCPTCTHDETALIEEIESCGAILDALVTKSEASHVASGGHAIDTRWVSIGRTDLQKGIMSLLRSVSEPNHKK